MPELCPGRGPKIRSNQDLFQETRRATVGVILTLWLRAIWSLICWIGHFMVHIPFVRYVNIFFSVPGIFKPGACQEKTFFWREKSCCSDYLLGLYCALSSKFRLMLILMEPIKGCTPATRIPNHPRNAATLLFVRPSVCMSILYGTMSGELRLQRRTKKPMNIQVSNLEKQEIFAFK